MEILLKRNYGYTLIIKADNVNIEEDIEDRIYHKNSEGKSDFTRPPVRDIKTDSLELFTSVLDDMIYYRQAEFDSSSLIYSLFEKLPNNIKTELLTKLNKQL